MQNSLYDKVITFRKEKLWEKCSEANVFAFEDYMKNLHFAYVYPEQNLMGHKSLGFVILYDEEAFLSFETFILGAHFMNKFDEDTLNSCNTIALRFYCLSDLPADFKKQSYRFKHYCSDNGEDISGPYSFPVMTSYDSFDEMERDILEEDLKVLDAGLDLMHFLAENPGTLSKATKSSVLWDKRRSSATPELPLFKPSKRGWALGRYLMPDIAGEKFTPVPVSSEFSHRRLMRLRQENSWDFTMEMNNTIKPHTITTDSGLSKEVYFDYTLNIRDNDNGSTYSGTLDTLENVEAFGQFFSDAIVKMGRRPLLLNVYEQWQKNILEDFCADLDIQIKMFNEDGPEIDLDAAIDLAIGDEYTLTPAQHEALKESSMGGVTLWKSIFKDPIRSVCYSLIFNTPSNPPDAVFEMLRGCKVDKEKRLRTTDIAIELVCQESAQIVFDLKHNRLSDDSMLPNVFILIITGELDISDDDLQLLLAYWKKNGKRILKDK